MKHTKITVGVVMVFGYITAHATDFVDTAPVMSAMPLVQRVVQQVCQPQTVVTPPSQSQGNGIAGAIVGGLAGGLLGAQIGHGSGKTAATIAGAAGGAIVGNQVAGGSSGRSTSQTVQSCSNVARDVVTGYTVVYRYNGRDITTTLPYDPGRYVRVGIGVIAEAGGPHRHHDEPMGMPPPPPPGY